MIACIVNLEISNQLVFDCVSAPVKKSTRASRRSSGGASVLLESIKKTYHRIRRSLSSARQVASPANTSSTNKHRSRSRRSIRRSTKSDVEPSCVLLRRFLDESCLVRLKRNPSTGQFDVGLNSDANGEVHVSGLASGSQRCSFKGRKFLCVGDRVLEVQNTRIADLKGEDTIDAIEELLDGCETATIRVVHLKHSKH